LLKQTKRGYAPKARLALLAAAGVLFVIILPLALLGLGGLLDRWLGWPALSYPPLNAIIGGLMVLAGWLLGLWTNYVQFTLGRGTPVPVMATQELIVSPPYSYCRNPMALGAIVAYLGVCVVAGSPGAALLVAVGAIALLTYIRLVEEKEMVARFGEAYLAYRRRVPFIIPRLHKGS
ncbi:MAG TPA: isoprenylcysteine carboxylmethyltransferase family protein, partial [Anaerolineae bacterium]|nr:isoprenylcysteine carboxylmethyltransferase family protein [Anaerolineae bacterium]